MKTIHVIVETYQLSAIQKLDKDSRGPKDKKILFTFQFLNTYRAEANVLKTNKETKKFLFTYQSYWV